MDIYLALMNGIECVKQIKQINAQSFCSCKKMGESLTTGPIIIDKELHLVGNGIDKTHIYSSTSNTFQILPDIEVSLKDLHIQSSIPNASIENNGHIFIRDNVRLSW